MTPYIILLAALLLIFFEFFLPGGLMATAGVVVLVISFAMAFVGAENGLEVFLFTVIAIAGLVFTVKGALWWIQKTKGKKSIYLESDQEGYRASSYPKEAVGQVVKAYTDLRPGGYISWEGKKIPAISMTGFIAKETEVVVLRGEGETLYVKSKE